MYNSTVVQYKKMSKKKRQVLCNEDCEQPFIWKNVIGISALHIVAVYTFIVHSKDAKLGTWIFSFIYGALSALGITAGIHRLWSHRSYSAKVPLRILLAMFYSMTGMNHFYQWIKDHRIHHKFTETPADPHDASRGFLFSHVGWLMMQRHPAVTEYGNKVDMSDIEADPVVQFFDKYHELIMVLLSFVIPTIIPIYFWNEVWYIAIFAVIVRFTWILNANFMVNSFAHMWGNRPYNRNVMATENPTVSFIALGEGWHNYHHSFPWDYKAAELPFYGLNPSTAFIDVMAWFGLAYDLKFPSSDLVQKVSVNEGDGTVSIWGKDHHHNHTYTKAK